MNSFVVLALKVCFFAWASVGLIVVSLNLETLFDRVGDQVFILLGSLLVFISWRRFYGWGRAVLGFAWIVFFSGMVKWMAVETGFPFGSVEYTDNIGPKFAGAVPLMIPLAWWIVIGALFLSLDFILFRLATARFFNTVLILLILPLLAISINLVVEPVGVQARQYWTWIEAGGYYGAPFSNFASMWAVAIVLCTGLSLLSGRRFRKQVEVKPEFWMPLAVLLVINTLFSVVNAVVGNLFPTVIGLVNFCWICLLISATHNLERSMAVALERTPGWLNRSAR